MSEENVILGIDGGAGKNIVGTVVVRELRKKYPDKQIIVMTGWPDIFKFNPNVDRVFRFDNAAYFYDQYIANGKGLFFKTEPYYSSDYILKKKHIAEVWCDQLGLPCESIVPELFVTKDEDKAAKEFIENKEKPSLLIQHTGGMYTTDPNVKKTFYTRDIPVDVAQSVGNIMSKTHHIFVAGYAEHFVWENAERLSFPLRSEIALLPYIDKFVLIDSLFQHATAAMHKQAVVCWSGTSPDVLGYSSHINLRHEVCKTPECHRPNTYLYDFGVNKDNFWECPYDRVCKDYTANEILEALGV